MSNSASKVSTTTLSLLWLKTRSYVRWQVSRVRRIPSRAINYLFGTLWYDLVLARRKRVVQGAVSKSNRYVVYLMFPKQGVQESHLRALRYFCERGYAPVVVSNVMLQSEDLKRVLKWAHEVIERPNYGYDFGGYRDGILHLQKKMEHLDRLVLMNDSVWFPLSGEGDWLVQADDINCDVVGAVANYCVQAKRLDSSPAVSWSYDDRNPCFHYCSFSLSFGSAVLKDPSFLGFWRQLRLSNDKFTTIGRGEVGLGQWVVRSGHSHRATFDIAHLDRDLDELSDDRLHEVAERLIIPEDAGLREQKRLVLAQLNVPNARQLLKNFVLIATAETGAAYALLDFALKEKGYCFVKKSPLWLDDQSAATTLQVLQELGEEDVLQEARLLVRPSAF